MSWHYAQHHAAITLCGKGLNHLGRDQHLAATPTNVTCEHCRREVERLLEERHSRRAERSAGR